MAGWVAGQLARRDPPPRAVNKRQEASDREQATESKGQRARGRERGAERVQARLARGPPIRGWRTRETDFWTVGRALPENEA